MDVDAGKVVAGRYRLESQLGSGGMGVVWRARDQVLGRTVAVKQLSLPAGLSERQSDEARRLAMREGRLAAKLQHSNSIMVFDVVEDRGETYLIMEYLPSRSLSDVLAERGPLPPHEVARIGSQAASALASAHAVGVVHRDIKPGNVLLGDDGIVKITDFGISRAVEDATVTNTGMLAGTPAYLAPEVAKGARADFASDVFSLGSTLYTAVEGTPPYGVADNAMALLYRVANGEITPPRQAGPLTDVLQRLLRTDPAQRPLMAQAGAELAVVAAKAAEQPTLGSVTTRRTTAVLPGLPIQDRDTHRAAPGDAGPALAAAPPAAAQPFTHAGQGDQGAAPPPATAGPVPAAPPRARPSAYPPPRPPGQRKPRRRGAVLALAAVLVLALVAVALILMLRPDGNGGTAAPPTTTATGTTASPSASQASQAPQQTSQPQPTTQPPATTEQTTQQPPAAGAANTPQAREQAITDYYALMPGNLQEGWPLLTARYQQRTAGGFSGYTNFWSQMASVRASDVSAGQGNTVDATIRYDFKSGKVVTERHRYALVEQGGRWLIDQHTVLSSVTT